MELLKTLDIRNRLNPITGLFSLSRNKTASGDIDDFQAHRTIVKNLEDFFGSDKPLDKSRLKTLQGFEKKGEPLQQELRCRYLQNYASRRQANDTLWKEIHAYYWFLSHSYLGFIRQHMESKNRGDIVPMLPAITASALCYLRLQIKWDYFRGENIKANMWGRIHTLYRLAESSGFAEVSVQFIDGGLTTCHREYTRILLMDLLTPARLDAVQIEALDALMDDWGNTMPLEKRFIDSLHTHCVDLSSNQGASKSDPEIDGDKVRYWNMNSIVREIFGSRKNLENIGDGEKFHPCELLEKSEVVDLLEFARKSWQRGEAQPPHHVHSADHGLVV